MIELIKALCNLDGPSGSEEIVRDFIQHEISDYADEITIDNIGNLIVFKKGAKTPKNRVMFCAHMDEVGFLVKRYTADGMVKFGFLGGTDPQVAVGKRVRFGDVIGVVGIKAVHMTTIKERKIPLKTSDLYIDIGTRTREAAEAKLEIASYGTFDAQTYEFGDGMIKAKALDNRIGCALLIDLIKSDLPYDAYFSFNVQEEVGLRGAMVSAYTVNPDIAVVLEATVSADITGIPEHLHVSKLTHGVVLSNMDNGTIYDKELYKKAIEIAKNNDIKWQIKTASPSTNESEIISQTRNGIKTLSIGVPVRYIHSPASVCSTHDVNQTQKMLQAFMKEGIC